ncbi:MAG: alpha/beta fold hydrolase [Oceanipulchritudo sp.]
MGLARFPSPDPDAPTILALHGFTGCGLDFLPMREAIGPEAASWICPDFMGHGKSASPAVLDPYTLPRALHLIDRARQQAANPAKVILAAYSMGARIALHYLRYARPLPALLISPNPGIREPAERGERRELDQRWITMLESSPMEEFCSAWEAQPLIEPQTRLPEPLRSNLAGRRRGNNPTGLAHSLHACGTGALPSLWDHLCALPPVTLVYGETDAKYAALCREMARANPSFRIVEISGAGHAPHLDAGRWTLAAPFADILSVAGIPVRGQENKRPAAGMDARDT